MFKMSALIPLIFIPLAHAVDKEPFKITPQVFTTNGNIEQTIREIKDIKTGCRWILIGDTQLHPIPFSCDAEKDLTDTSSIDLPDLQPNNN